MIYLGIAGLAVLGLVSFLFIMDKFQKVNNRYDYKFLNKTQYEHQLKEIGNHIHDHPIVDARIQSLESLKVCETCGCVIGKEKEIRGESVVVKDYITNIQQMMNGMIWGKPVHTPEHIHTPYYCQRCKPRGKGK